MISALTDAITFCGSQSELARRLGISAPTIAGWQSGKRPIPERRAIEIEQITNGAVTCEELRPDVPWHILRGNSPRQPSEAA